MSGIRRWELRVRIAGLSFGEVIIIVLAVLISCGMDERNRKGQIGGGRVPVCIRRRQMMDFERVLHMSEASSGTTVIAITIS